MTELLSAAFPKVLKNDVSLTYIKGLYTADQNSQMYRLFEWLFSRVLASHRGRAGTCQSSDL
jgi:hypothetical protein